jgi:hypothetical protein
MPGLRGSLMPADYRDKRVRAFEPRNTVPLLMPCRRGRPYRTRFSGPCCHRAFLPPPERLHLRPLRIARLVRRVSRGFLPFPHFQEVLESTDL